MHVSLNCKFHKPLTRAADLTHKLCVLKILKLIEFVIIDVICVVKCH